MSFAKNTALVERRVPKLLATSSSTNLGSYNAIFSTSLSGTVNARYHPRHPFSARGFSIRAFLELERCLLHTLPRSSQAAHCLFKIHVGGSLPPKMLPSWRKTVADPLVSAENTVLRPSTFATHDCVPVSAYILIRPAALSCTYLRPDRQRACRRWSRSMW